MMPSDDPPVSLPLLPVSPLAPPRTRRKQQLRRRHALLNAPLHAAKQEANHHLPPLRSRETTSSSFGSGAPSYEKSYEQLFEMGKAESKRHQGLHKKSQTVREALRRSGEARSAVDAATAVQDLTALISKARTVSDAAQNGAGDREDVTMHAHLEAEIDRLRRYVQHAAADELLKVFRKARQGGFFSNTHAVDAVREVLRGFNAASDLGIQPDAPAADINAAATNIELWLRSMAQAGDPTLLTAQQVSVEALSKVGRELSPECVAACGVAAEWEAAVKKLEEEMAAAQKVVETPKADSATLEIAVKGVADVLLAAVAKGIKGQESWYDQLANMCKVWLSRLQEEGCLAALARGIDQFASWNIEQHSLDHARFRGVLKDWQNITGRVEKAMEKAFAVKSSGQCTAAEAEEAVTVLRSGLCDAEAAGLQLETSWIGALSSALEVWLRSLLRSSDATALEEGLRAANRDMGHFGAAASAANEDAGAALSAWRAADSAITAAAWLAARSTASVSKLDSTAQNVFEALAVADATGLHRRPTWNSKLAEILEGWIVRLMQEGVTAALVSGHAKASALAAGAALLLPPAFATAEKRIELWKQHEAAIQSALDKVVHELGQGAPAEALARSWSCLDASLDAAKIEVSSKLSVLSAALRDGEAAGLRLQMRWKITLADALDAWLDGLLGRGEIRGLQLGLTVAEGQAATLGVELHRQEEARKKLAVWIKDQTALQQLHEKSLHRISSKAPSLDIEELVTQLGSTQRDAIQGGLCLRPEWNDAFARVLCAWLSQLMRDGNTQFLAIGQEKVTSLTKEFELGALPVHKEVAETLEKWYQHEAAIAQAVELSEKGDSTADSFRDSVLNLRQTLLSAEAAGLKISQARKAPLVALVEKWLPALVAGGGIEALKHGLSTVEALREEMALESSQDYPKLRDLLTKWQEADHAMRKASSFAAQTTSMGSSPGCALEACAAGLHVTIKHAKDLGLKLSTEVRSTFGKTLDAWLGRLVQDGEMDILESGLNTAREWRQDLGSDVEFDESGVSSRLDSLRGHEDGIHNNFKVAQAVLKEQAHDIAVLGKTARDFCASLREAEEQGLRLKPEWMETAIKLVESWVAALVKSGDMKVLEGQLDVATGLAAELGNERLPELQDAAETLDQWRDAAEAIEEAGGESSPGSGRKNSKSPTRQMQLSNSQCDGLSRSLSSKRLQARGDGSHSRAVGRLRKSLVVAERVGLALKPEWTANLIRLAEGAIAAAVGQGDTSVLSAALQEISEAMSELRLQGPESLADAQAKLGLWTTSEERVLTAMEAAQKYRFSQSPSIDTSRSNAQELHSALCEAKQEGLALKPEWLSTLSGASNSWLEALKASGEVGNALENGLETIDSWLTELGFPEPSLRATAWKLLNQARSAEHMARQADKCCRQALAHEAPAETLECAISDMRTALLTVQMSKSVMQAEWITVLTQVLNAWLLHLVQDGEATELRRGIDTAKSLCQELPLPKLEEQGKAEITLEKWRQAESSMDAANSAAEALREDGDSEDVPSQDLESAALKLKTELRNAKSVGLRPGMEWQSALTSALDAWLQATVKERDAAAVETTMQTVNEIAAEEDIPPPASLGDVKLRLLQWSHATKAVNVAKQRAVQAIKGDSATSLLEEAVDLTHKALRELHTAELPLQLNLLEEWLQLEMKHLERRHDDLALLAVTSRLEGFARLLATGLEAEAPESFCATCTDNVVQCASQLVKGVEVCDVVADIGRIIKFLVPILELLRSCSASCHEAVRTPLERARARRKLLEGLGEEIRAAMGDVKALRGLLLKAEKLVVKSLPELRLAQHEVTLQEFEIVDARGGQSGKVQISLMWTNLSEKTDLDILLFHPQGRTYFEEKKNKGSLYELDIDDTGQDEGVESCENVFWPADSSQDPPVGWHEVKVLHYEGPLVDLRVALKLGTKRTILSYPAEALPKREEGSTSPEMLSACKFYMNTGTSAEVHHPEGVHLTSGDDLLKQLQVWLADARLTESPKTLRLLIDKTQQLFDKLKQGPLDAEVAKSCEQAIRSASDLHDKLMKLITKLKHLDADLELLSSAVQEAEKYGALEWPEAESARVALEAREALASLIQDFTRGGVEQSAEKFARRAQRVATDTMATKSAQADIVARLKEMRNVSHLVESKLEAAEHATFGKAQIQHAECNCAEIMAARHLRTVLVRSLLAGEACGFDEAALSEIIHRASVMGVEGDDVTLAMARLRRVSAVAGNPDMPSISEGKAKS